jgi:hypothetical protein
LLLLLCCPPFLVSSPFPFKLKYSSRRKHLLLQLAAALKKSCCLLILESLSLRTLPITIVCQKTTSRWTVTLWDRSTLLVEAKYLLPQHLQDHRLNRHQWSLPQECHSTKPPAGSPPTKSPKRELRGTATSDDSRSLAVFSYKKVFSGAGAYGCKLCLRDNADRRLQVGVDMAAYDAFMSEGLSNDLNALNKLAIATILEGKPSCLGSGTIPIKAIFLSSPSY